MVNEYATRHEISWFEHNIIDTVPLYYKGAGRKVCPGFMLLGGFMSMNMKKHSVANMTHFKHLIQGDMDNAQYHRGFYDEYRAVLDVPATYFLESLDHAFLRHTLPKGEMTWRGYPIDTKAIEKTALLTIEGELDDISCPGQTLAAHDLCKNIPKSKKKAYLQKGVGHYGIFNGRRWRDVIQPKIATFIRANGG
jgi:poly(3-hydroxybutyrate) depolymerase